MADLQLLEWLVRDQYTDSCFQLTSCLDTLFTQDSVVVSQDVRDPSKALGSLLTLLKYLFAVNPGSNTVAMFFIDKDDPYHPKLIGSPADSMGEFPVSVAYSPRLKTGKTASQP